jgi:hypothetical protein
MIACIPALVSSNERGEGGLVWLIGYDASASPTAPSPGSFIAVHPTLHGTHQSAREKICSP